MKTGLLATSVSVVSWLPAVSFFRERFAMERFAIAKPALDSVSLRPGCCRRASARAGPAAPEADVAVPASLSAEASSGLEDAGDSETPADVGCWASRATPGGSAWRGVAWDCVNSWAPPWWRGSSTIKAAATATTAAAPAQRKAGVHKRLQRDADRTT